MACVVVAEAVLLTSSTTRAVPSNEVDSHGQPHQGTVPLFQSMLLACYDHMFGCCVVLGPCFLQLLHVITGFKPAFEMPEYIHWFCFSIICLWQLILSVPTQTPETSCHHKNKDYFTKFTTHEKLSTKQVLEFHSLTQQCISATEEVDFFTL
jgi:hypothetical protein